MGKYYIGNRVWYVGYTWINFDNDNIETIAKEENSAISSFDKRAFASNYYTAEEGDDILYASCSPEKLVGKFENENYDSSKTLLEFKFLTNGCVNIILTMEPKDPDGFSKLVSNLDKDGAEEFVEFNEQILEILLPLLQKLVDQKIIECNDTSLWGIPSYLSKEPLNLKKLEDFGNDPDKMHGTKTLHWSILYVQHVLSDDEADYHEFTGVKNEITLRIRSIEEDSNQTIRATIGNGKLYWNGGSNEYNDVKLFLETEAVLLSKNVIVTTSIIFNTELSLILLKDNELCAKASVDDLRKPNALLRTHLACTEMFIPALSEASLNFYEKYDELEGKMIHNRIHLQKESEETLFQIANSTELTKNAKKAAWFQFFLVVISAMTVFSVLQDISSFVLIDSSPEPENYRLSFVLVVSVLLGWLIYDYIPTKKEE